MQFYNESNPNWNCSIQETVRFPKTFLIEQYFIPPFALKFSHFKFMHKYVSRNSVNSATFEKLLSTKKKHNELQLFKLIIPNTFLRYKRLQVLQVYLLWTVDFAVLSTYNEVRFKSEGLPDFRDSYHRKILCFIW